MTLQSLDTPMPARLRRGRRLSAPVAFGLLVSIPVSFLAGSAAPTPLYGVYQERWGFSPITTTVVFGVYALAVLAALLTVGRLSDHLGRRPVLLAGIAAQAAAMLIFVDADGVGDLLLGRVAQGLATGAVAAAVGAGLLDIDRVRGTLANAVATPIGTAAGSLLAGLLVQFLPAPTRLVYLALFVILLVQAAGVTFMTETASRIPGALNSLRPRFAAPPRTRKALLTAVPALLAAWSLAGLYGALGPALVHSLSGSASVLLGGLSLFVLAGSGAVAVLLLRGLPARAVMQLGTLGLVVGTAGMLVAVSLSSTAGFFTGTVVAGAGFGSAFQGAIRTVLPLAEAHERAGLLSVVYTASYLAMGGPAVIAGILVVHSGGLLRTVDEYGAAVIALAAVALLQLLRRPRPACISREAVAGLCG